MEIPQVTPKDKFESEADLCAVFASKARDEGWEVFPEVKGWDLVLRWPLPPPEWRQWPAAGDLVGVEAKNAPSSLDALLQVAERRKDSRDFPHHGGPHFTAILVPTASATYRRIATHLHTAVFVPSGDRTVINALETRDHSTRGMWLPPFVPNLPAGTPSPRTLSKWRMRALGVVLELRRKGFVTRNDFVAHGFSPNEASQWAQRHWLRNTGDREGKLVKYAPGSNTRTSPTAGYEDVLTQMEQNSQSKAPPNSQK